MLSDQITTSFMHLVNTFYIQLSLALLLHCSDIQLCRNAVSDSIYLPLVFPSLPLDFPHLRLSQFILSPPHNQRGEMTWNELKYINGVCFLTFVSENMLCACVNEQANVGLHYISTQRSVGFHE